MTVKTVTKVNPAFSFEAYSYVVSPIGAMADMGQEVPTPVFKVDDFTPASASGKVLARLPRSMHMQLTARAKTEGVSLNSLLLALIAEGLGRRSATL